MSRSTTLAWGLWVVWLALTAVAVLLVAFAGASSDELMTLATVGFATVGALIASRRPANAVGWTLLGTAVALVFSAAGDAYVGAGELPLGTVVAWVSTWSWYLWLVLAAIVLPLVFPNGRLLSRRWRPVLGLALIGVAMSVAGAALAPGRLDVDSTVPIQNPVGVEGGAADVVALAATIGDVLAGLCFLLAAASLALRYRRARGAEREQVKWFAYVGLLALLGLVMAMTTVLFGTAEDPTGRAPGTWELIGTVGWSAALFFIIVGIPAATAIAVLRHRLYDIDVVINRTLVYGGLTAALVAAYLGSVLLLQLALSPVTSESDLAIAGSTLAVAALFRPLRSRIQAIVDRRFFRRRYDAARTLEGFAGHLREEVDLDALGMELRTVVRETMQPAHTSLWLRPPAEGGR